MANSTPMFVGALRTETLKLATQATDVDGAGSSLLFAGDVTNGSRIHGLSAIPTNDLSAAVVARLFIEDSGVYTILGEKAIPAYTAATGSAAPITNFLEYADLPFLDPGDKFLMLGPGQKLYVSLLVTPTNTIHFTAQGGDY